MGQTFLVGQAFWGRIKFVDGGIPAYDRLYLVVGVDHEYIEILNVSSVEGKEWKLTLPANREIRKYDPPFPRRTFVKLDSWQRVSVADLGAVSFSRHGAVLDEAELQEITKSIRR